MAESDAEVAAALEAIRAPAPAVPRLVLATALAAARKRARVLEKSHGEETRGVTFWAGTVERASEARDEYVLRAGEVRGECTRCGVQLGPVPAVD